MGARSDAKERSHPQLFHLRSLEAGVLQAVRIRDVVSPAMVAVRTHADALERCVDDDLCDGMMSMSTAGGIGTAWAR